MGTFRRADRVASEVQAVLMQIFRDGLRDPRVTPITLTSVRVSDDLRHAYVGFVPLGGQGDPDNIVKGLKAASGYMRRELGRRLRFRYVPALHFSVDEGLDESVRMMSLLQSMEDRRTAAEAEE